MVMSTSPLASSVWIFSFLEINANVLVLKGSGVIQAIDRVPGKSANGLGNHHIDLAIMAVVYHALKLITLFFAFIPEMPSSRKFQPVPSPDGFQCMRYNAGSGRRSWFPVHHCPY